MKRTLTTHAAEIERLTRENSEHRQRIQRLEDAVGYLVRELEAARKEARTCPLAVGGCGAGPAAGVTEVRFDC
jgi:predicted RNase H-like nuclease (RuvC/YqgF family)